MPIDKELLFSAQQDFVKKYMHVNQPTFSSENVQQINVPPEQGEGFFDFHHFDDFLLGRAHVTFYQQNNFLNDSIYHSYGIHILMSGEMTISLDDGAEIIKARSPEIFFSKGINSNLRVIVDTHCTIRTLAIELNEEFILPLIECSGENCLGSQLVTEKTSGFIRLPQPSAKTIQLASSIYDYNVAKNAVDYIALQGATLSLISDIIRLPAIQIPSTKRSTLGAQRAQQILDERFCEQWTILQLSREAGTNECYLKREFKRLTGHTINTYQKIQRMKTALILLENGEPNLESLATQLGYQSKDYFVRVFQQHFGFHPKKIKERSEKCAVQVKNKE